MGPLTKMLYSLAYPILAAQLYIVFLCYFVAVRKHVARHYQYYIFFLIGLIYYLALKPVQDFSPDWRPFTRYTRTSVLFAVGAPSLVMAALIQCGYQLKTKYIVGIYLLGLFFGGMYSVLYDLSRAENSILYPLGITKGLFREYISNKYLKHTWPQSVGSVVMFVIPSIMLLIKELKRNDKAEPLMFVIGTLLFSIGFAYGSISHEFWVYYLGAFASAPFWGWAILHDIRKLKNKADTFIAMIPGQAEIQKENNYDDIVIKVKEFIDLNFVRDLGVDEISESAGVSRSHCMKLFKEQTGMTVNQYLTEVRICKAKLLLLSKTVTDTAFDVGYNDSNYFSKVFKKHTGQTPVQYQQSARVSVSTK